MIDEANRNAARASRLRTIRLAWSSLLVSKVVTFATQVLAIPTAYRALGADGFAAYAAVTASANLIWALNLGIGGALVTPITEAAACGDRRREAQLVHSGLAPLMALCLLGAALALPVLFYVPLEALFGQAGSTGLAGIRPAAVIAMVATLLTIPLSGIDALRQAYQEMHIGVIIGTVFNVVMCVGLLLAARYSHSLIIFVVIFVVPQLLSKVVSSWMLLVRRKYLLQGFNWAEVKRQMPVLMGDGIRYLSSSYSGMLVYQWPVYWMTRHEATQVSSSFAICTQLALVPVSSVLGMVTPLWSPIADARAKGDFVWLRHQIVKLQKIALLAGSAIFVTVLVGGDWLVRIWLGKGLGLGWQLRGLVGLYVLLAIWEGLHLTLCFGLGHLRQAALAVFYRVLCFAVAVPVLAYLGGARVLWAGLCCSVIGYTAWRLPVMGGITWPWAHSTVPDTRAELDGALQDPETRLL